MGNLPGALPVEKICCFLLNEKFSKLLKKKITKDQLTVVGAGTTIVVTDIELNPSVFNAGRKSVLLRAARIGNVQIQIPVKAAKSFFSNAVQDNLNVKVSDVVAEFDFLTDCSDDAAQQASDEEGIVAAFLADIGVSPKAPVSLGDSWSELEAQSPSDADGRKQLSHVIKQFLLLAEIEVSGSDGQPGLSVVCNVFRSGNRYHPSQFRFTVDSATLLNDFSHLKEEKMPSSSVEPITDIVFGRQFRIGGISIEARDCLADHCAAASFEDQKWVTIFSANLPPSPHLRSCPDPFCKFQFKLKDFDSDTDISVLKVEISIDDVELTMDFLHLQLLLSFANTFLNKGTSQAAGVATASLQNSVSGPSESAKRASLWFEQAGSMEDALTVCINSVSFLVACSDQPLRKMKRRPADCDWLFTLQTLRLIAGPVQIHATCGIVLFQELFVGNRRNEIARIQNINHQQNGISVTVACDGSSTDISVAGVRLDLDFELLHRLNAAFYWPVKSLQALFPKSTARESASSSSSLRLNAISVDIHAQLPDDIISYYRVQPHSSGTITLSLRGLSLQFNPDQSFAATFDDAEVKLSPDFVIVRHGLTPNTIKYSKKNCDHDRSLFCMACEVALGSVEVRLSIEMRQLIFALGTEFDAHKPLPPSAPPPSLGTNFKQDSSQSSDDEQFDRSPLGNHSVLATSVYDSAVSSFPDDESANVSQSTDPIFFPLYLVLMRNAIHAMGASFSAEDSFAPEIPNLALEPSLLSYTMSVLVDNFVIVLAGAATSPDSMPLPTPSQQPFFCGLNSSHRDKLAELNAIDALVLLSQRLQIAVSLAAEPSNIMKSQLKFGSCQIIDSYDRVHLEPFYPFDGMLPPQSVSEADRRENGQVAVNFPGESEGNCIDVMLAQLLVHSYTWIDDVIRFFKDTQPVDGEKKKEHNRHNKERSEDAMLVTLRLQLVAVQPSLLPSSFSTPLRLLVEEASVSLTPGAENIKKTICVHSKAVHLMVAPHVDHVMNFCNRLINGARNAHFNAVERQHAPKQENSANPHPDIARILRADCTLNWLRMPPLEFSASCGFLCLASVPTLYLPAKPSSVGDIFEIRDLELVVFTCADSLARFFDKTDDDDDYVFVPRAKLVETSVASDEVNLSDSSGKWLPEEHYRQSPGNTATGHLDHVYDDDRTLLNVPSGHSQIDASGNLSEASVQEHADGRAVPLLDEIFLDLSSSSIPNIFSPAPIHQAESSSGQVNGHQRDTSVDHALDSFLNWRLDLVNVRVRFRLFAGCDFPEYVSLGEAASPCSPAASSSIFPLLDRDMDRSLELQVEGMRLQYSCFDHPAPISSRIFFTAQDVKIVDNVSGSYFRCLIQRDELYLECGAYEQGAPAIRLTLDTLQNNVSGCHDSEFVQQRRFEAQVLPLCCNLDQHTLKAIYQILHVYASVASDKNDSIDSGNQGDDADDRGVFQNFFLSALHLRLNYKPINIPLSLKDHAVSLDSIQLWNCPPRQILESVISQWGGYPKIALQLLGGIANTLPVVSNVSHILSALNVLIQESIRNRSGVRHVRRNVFAFLSVVSGEIIDVALCATQLADQMLVSASTIFVGNSKRERQDCGATGGARDVRAEQMLQSLREDLKKIRQPENVQDGLQEAVASFTRSLECMMMMLLQPGRHSRLRRGAAAIMMPVQGANRGVFQFLQGLMNHLRPQRRARRDEQ